MRSLILTSVAALCFQLAVTPVALAADHDFCERYARNAREQLEIARDRCFRRIDLRHARWQSSYEEHYRWCRAVSYRDADREREIRHDELERCRR